MFGYYENTANFYTPELELPFNAVAMNLMLNYLHRQSSVEVVCVMRGAVSVAVEGREYRLQPGDVLTINTQQPHRYFDGTEDGLQLMYSFDPSLLHRQEELQIDLATVGPNALSRSDPLVGELRGAIGQLVSDVNAATAELRQRQPVDSITWHSAHMGVHHVSKLLLSRAVPRGTVAPGFPEPLLQCIDYVHGHYQSACAAEDVARGCGLSPRAVRQLFHQYLGVTFNEFVNSIRVVAAASLLQNTDCSIVDAAADMGLSSSSLYRLFRQETGMTPGEFVARSRREGRTLSYLEMPVDRVHIYGRNRFAVIPSETLDWDWLTGKKGWNFD